MKNYNILILLLLLIGLNSCFSNKTDSYTRYMAVILEGSTKWSIVDQETGEILFKDEFDTAPTRIRHGLFAVKNAEGLYDVYSVKDVNKSLNTESYVTITLFDENGYALAVKSNSNIVIINQKCEEIKELPDDIIYASQFSDGMSSFISSSSNLHGFINEYGEIIIPAKYKYNGSYKDGIAIVGNDSVDFIQYYAIDKEGKVLFSFTNQDYEAISEFSEGLFGVAKDNKYYYLNKKGEKQLELGQYNNYFYYFRHNLTTFFDGQAYGLKDKEGKIVLRPKYEELQLSHSSDITTLIAKRYGKYGLINEKEEKILPFIYDKMSFSSAKNRVFAIKDSLAYLFDTKGNLAFATPFVNTSNLTYYGVYSNKLNAEYEAKKILNAFDTLTCNGHIANEPMTNFRHLYSNVKPTRDDLYKKYLQEDSNGIIKRYVFQKPIANEDFFSPTFNEEENNLDLVLLALNLNYFDIDAEKQVLSCILNGMKAKGFSLCPGKEMIFKSDNGKYVQYSYYNGYIVAWYYYADTETLSDRPCEERSDITRPHLDYSDWLGIDKNHI